MPRDPAGGSRQRRRRSREPLLHRMLALAAVSLVLLLASPPGSASAHAELVSTTPAEGAVLSEAPGSAEFTFDEPVFLVPDGFQLYDTEGGHRTLSTETAGAEVEAVLPRDLAPGSYVIGWRVVSDDSHPESGVLSFAVGEASLSAPSVTAADDRPVDILYGILNAAGYLGLFCLVGLTVFDLFVARVAPLARRVARVSAAVAVSAYAALVPLTAAREQGRGLGALLDPANLGRSDGALLTLALVAGGIALMVLSARLTRSSGLWVGTLGAAAALTSVLPVGHTRTFEPLWLMMSADLIHAATAAVWLGGLLALILHLARARQSDGDPAEAAAVLGRFSSLAGGVALLLGATGATMAVVIVGSVPALFDNAYGLLLLAKLAVVAVIGGLAAWNRFALLPRVRHDGAARVRSWHQLGSAIRLEAIGVVVVVAITSALTLQNPGASVTLASPSREGIESSVPVGTTMEADLGTGRLTGRFSPGTAEVNVITFDITDAAGIPLVPLTTPEVTIAEPNLCLGPFAALVEPGETPGSFRAVVSLPVPGQWKITTAVRVNELEQPAAVADVVVVGRAGATSAGTRVG